MNAALNMSPLLPWTLAEDDEQRFRRILISVGVLFALLTSILQYLTVPQMVRHSSQPMPAALARLIIAPKPVVKTPLSPVKPRIKPQVKPIVKLQPKVAVRAPVTPRKTPVKKPTTAVSVPVEPRVNTVQAARAKAQRSGVLAFKDTLADLREQTVVTGVATHSRSPGPSTTSTSVERSLITSNLAQGSGGINTAALSRDTGGGGLAGHAATRVRSTLDSGGGAASGGRSAEANATGSSASRTAGRSVEEIQTIFDRNKGAIYAIYNRALRSDPALQGKVVLKLTILASGRVSACSVVSSDLQTAELERKITSRILLFDFGAKDVGTMTITYPLDFLPA